MSSGGAGLRASRRTRRAFWIAPPLPSAPARGGAMAEATHAHGHNDRRRRSGSPGRGAPPPAGAMATRPSPRIDAPAGDRPRCNRRLIAGCPECKPERASFRVTAHRPLRPGMNHGSTVRSDLLERRFQVSDREVGKRCGIPRAAASLVDADRDVAVSRLPAAPFGRGALLELHGEQRRPEPSGAIGIVGGKLDQRERVAHRDDDNARNPPTPARSIPWAAPVRCARRCGGFTDVCALLMPRVPARRHGNAPRAHADQSCGAF